jgi:hypothetical protein
MCETCVSPAAAVPCLRRRRLKIGEIDAQWHCTIIATCLTQGELKSLAAKLRLNIQIGSNGYQLHSGMVHLASRDRAVSKALTKLLDRKHALAVTRFAKAEDDAKLLELWADALAKGEVASACWAVMSHGGASDDTRNAVFQEIHMLSHQVGAVTRADLRLIHGLEKDKAELEAKVARQQTRLRDEINGRDEEIRDLRQDLACEIAESRRLAHASVAVEELDSLRRLVDDLGSQLIVETNRHLHTAEEKKRF